MLMLGGNPLSYTDPYGLLGGSNVVKGVNGISAVGVGGLLGGSSNGGTAQGGTSSIDPTSLSNPWPGSSTQSSSTSDNIIPFPSNKSNDKSAKKCGTVSPEDDICERKRVELEEKKLDLEAERRLVLGVIGGVAKHPWLADKIQFLLADIRSLNEDIYEYNVFCPRRVAPMSEVILK